MNCIFGVEHLSSSDEINEFLGNRYFYEMQQYFDNPDGTRFAMISNYFPATHDKSHVLEVVSFYREDEELSDIPDEEAYPYLDSKIELVLQICKDIYDREEDLDDLNEEWDELDSINPLPYDDY